MSTAPAKPKTRPLSKERRVKLYRDQLMCLGHNNGFTMLTLADIFELPRIQVEKIVRGI